MGDLSAADEQILPNQQTNSMVTKSRLGKILRVHPSSHG
ncbi:hypothetical protein NIES4075_73320 [Tolypothrix sp. NIES-4075]|nr:hypothetical protein NIES4075_73320 [Tolypothrix sp. NIES-4075]